MLLLSALWVAWRNGFSPSSLVLAVAALLGGSLFLATYLLILTFTTNCTIKQVLVGEKSTAEDSTQPLPTSALESPIGIGCRIPEHKD